MLRELPRKIERNLLNRALIQGAVLVRDRARQLVPLLRTPDPRRVRGAVQRAIRAGRVRPQAPYAATVWIRVRPLTKVQISRFKKARAKAGQRSSGAFNPNDPFYWRFIEFGTSKMAARPFLRPAFESMKVVAVERAIRAARVEVQQEIAKLGRATWRTT